MTIATFISACTYFSFISISVYAVRASDFINQLLKCFVLSVKYFELKIYKQQWNFDVHASYIILIRPVYCFILIVSYWPLNLLLWVYFSYYLIIIGLLICLFYTLIVIVCCLTHFLTCLLYSILHATFLVYINLTTRVYAQRNAVKFSCLLVFTLFILRIFYFRLAHIKLYTHINFGCPNTPIIKTTSPYYKYVNIICFLLCKSL